VSRISLGATMAQTADELRARIEASESKLIGKLENATKDILDFVNKRADKIESDRDAALAVLRQDIKGLSEGVAKTAADVAAIDATIKTTKLISIVAAIIVTLIGAVIAVVGSAGLNQYLKDREQLQNVLRSSALLTQAALVEKLEETFQKIGSLDSLNEQVNVRAEIKDISDHIRRISENLETSQQSTYYIVGQAVEIYLSNNCAGVVENLKRVKTADQGRLFYAYLRGICSLRLNQLADADYWLGIAVQSKDTRQASVILNLQGVTRMGHARATGKRELAMQAIKHFESSIATDQTYAPAYFNLACAYAHIGEFDAVSAQFKKLMRDLRTPPDTIVGRIRDDQNRSGEQFLSDYLQVYLEITVPATDPRWSELVRAALLQL
jgi:tetratricopeptide (TPR) repeat protein